MVSSIDLAPTILAACGLEPTPQMHGFNLLDSKALAQREAVFGGVFTHDEIDIENPTRNLLWRWCVSGWWKLCVPHQPNVPNASPELYNLKDDPFEKTNLAEKEPAKVRQLRALLDQWWRPA